jgi:two-component system nitrate/nitrite response regulator NarL
VIRVFIVAAVRLYREGLALLLGRDDTITVVGTACNLEEALPALRRLRPDIALVELDLSGTDRIADAVATGVKIVALGIDNDENAVIDCAEAGAVGFVTRDDPLAEIEATIACIAAGGMPCSPNIAAALLRRLAEVAAQPSAVPRSRLTPRELEIVGLIDEGMSNKAIAMRLSIELATVKNHVHNILDKLNVTRRIDAAMYLRSPAAARVARPSGLTAARRRD